MNHHQKQRPPGGADNRPRSYDPAYDTTAPPDQKEISELLQDPQFISVLLSLTFSIGVFFYFFYKLMYGIREDYRKQKKMRQEAERRAALGLDDEDEEEEEEQDAATKAAKAGKANAAKQIESVDDKVKRIAAATEERKKVESNEGKKSKKESDRDDDEEKLMKSEKMKKKEETVENVRQRKKASKE